MFYRIEDLCRSESSNICVFKNLDNHFINKRNIKDKNNYFMLRSDISQLITDIEKSIFYDIKEKSNDEIIFNIEFFFSKVATLKDKYIQLVAQYERKQIKEDKYEAGEINDEIYKFKNFLWYESIRKTRNNIIHENIKPEIQNVNNKLWFNYFHVVDSQKTTIPFIYFHNSHENLVNFNLYAGCVLHCFIVLISEIVEEIPIKSVAEIDIASFKFKLLLKDIFKLNHSEKEKQRTLFFGMYGYKKKEIEKILSLYKNKKFNLVEKSYIAGLYLFHGYNFIKEKDYDTAMIHFKKSLELNYDLAQISNIIGASISIDNRNDLIIDFIKEHTLNASNAKYIRFFSNSGNYLSSCNLDLAEKIFSIGYNFVDENEESVDFLYNYAHFMKNDKHNLSSALDLCLEILQKSPIDKGAHKMILRIYDMTGQHRKIKEHITNHLQNIEEVELKKHMEFYLQEYVKRYDS